MVFLDPPEHLAFRRLVAFGFTPRQVDLIEPQIRQFVVERIERLVEMGSGDIVASPAQAAAQLRGGALPGRAEADRAASTTGPRASWPPMRWATRWPPPMPWATSSATSPNSSSTGGRISGTTRSPSWWRPATAAGVSALQMLGLRLHHGRRRQRHHHRPAQRRAGVALGAPAQQAMLIGRSGPDPRSRRGTAAAQLAGPGPGPHHHPSRDAWRPGDPRGSQGAVALRLGQPRRRRCSVPTPRRSM